MNMKQEEMLIDNAYRYYAFISYKRTDSKWADWVYKNLQNYRLPGKLCKTHKELPKRLCPIFIDKQELLPGTLSDTLKKDIAQCKYFISICSKNTQNNPEYIDMELQYFLETHNNDHTRVIPFIVDESKKPEEECFSPLMQELGTKYQLIGVNVTEKGKKRAFLKVVAYMHGIKVSEIESADDIRRRKNAAVAALFSIMVVGSCIFGWNYWWKHIAVHEDYYQTYVWENNVAKGVGLIDKDNISKYSRYYLIRSVGDRVQSVEYMNYAGTLVPLDDVATVLNQNASKVEFIYDGEDAKNLYMAKYYDYNGRPLVCYQYSVDGTHVTLLQDEESGLSGYASMNNSDLNIFADRINVTRYVQELDENGRIIKRYYAYGENYARVSDGAGMFGYDLAYDEAGNLMEITYFNTQDGTSYGEIGGIRSTVYKYSQDNARIQSITYLDQDGNLVNGTEGWAQKEYEWHENNAKLKFSYLGQDGKSVLLPDNYASVKYEYEGNVLASETYLDCEGKVINSLDGYASATYKVNDIGQIVSCRYWDEDGNAAANVQDGVYGYEISEINETEDCRMYVDQNGKPSMTNAGYAYMYVTRDEFNYPVKIEYRDEENMLCTQHYASCTYKYDPVYHALLECRYFDENANPLIVEEVDCAAVVYEYDGRGFTTLIEYLDENGKLYEGKRGYAKVTGFSELDGTYTTETYMFYDSDNNPVKHKILNAVGYEYTTYENGKTAGICYLNESKFPYFNEEKGYAGVNYLYDEYGYISCISYFGESLQPVMVDGYATMYVNYDQQGHMLSCMYYNDSGEVAVNYEEGYASVLYDYDEEGRIIEIAYFDEQSLPMNHLQQGYAVMTAEYDENGKIQSGGFWKVENGKLVPMM